MSTTPAQFNKLTACVYLLLCAAEIPDSPVQPIMVSRSNLRFSERDLLLPVMLSAVCVSLGGRMLSLEHCVVSFLHHLLLLYVSCTLSLSLPRTDGPSPSTHGDAASSSTNVHASTSVPTDAHLHTSSTSAAHGHTAAVSDSAQDV